MIWSGNKQPFSLFAYADSSAARSGVELASKRFVQGEAAMARNAVKRFPDYAPSSAKPWDCKTSGNQGVGAFRRLFAFHRRTPSSRTHLPPVLSCALVPARRP